VTVPDYPEPLRGWRAWRVVETRTGLRLCSVIHDQVWQPGRPLQATCAGAGGAHRAPAAGCTCGIYGSRSSVEAARYLIGRNDPSIVHRVVGVVALWGAVFEGVAGWRAARAYPERLWVPNVPRAGEIARHLRVYGAPVQTVGAQPGLGVAAEIPARP
jgi:hypothetical protein